MHTERFRDENPYFYLDSEVLFDILLPPTRLPRPLTSTILGPLAMYWNCFQRFLESLTDVLIFNLDFAENFVSSIIYIVLPRTTPESSSSRNVRAYGNAPSARLEPGLGALGAPQACFDWTETHTISKIISNGALRTSAD